MFTKFASTAIIAVEKAPNDAAGLRRMAHRAVFDYEARPGYIYIRSRAISSRCNDNFDEFPAPEIKEAYKTFVGKPVFVNHNNDNHRRARGVIIDAALHEDTGPDGRPDTWAEVLMEVDAVRFPKLAKAILAGHIDRTSMGTDVAFSVCSACGNKATTPLEYCAHIPRMKGMRIQRTTASGKKEGVLIREICHGLKFFENSLLVEEPADPTAFFLGVEAGPGVRTQATRMIVESKWPFRNAPVDDGMGQGICPNCNHDNSRHFNQGGDTMKCNHCSCATSRNAAPVSQPQRAAALTPISQCKSCGSDKGSHCDCEGSVRLMQNRGDDSGSSNSDLPQWMRGKYEPISQCKSCGAGKGNSCADGCNGTRLYKNVKNKFQRWVTQSALRQHIAAMDDPYGDAPRQHAPQGISPSEEWHGPYEVVQHPDTGHYHTVDNQGREASGLSLPSQAGTPDLDLANRRRDHVDQSRASKEKAKGIADKLWNDTNEIFDPGGTEESRRSDKNMRAANQLLNHYEPHHIKYDPDDEPYAEATHPSGWQARDYGGVNLHIHHAATGEDLHEALDVGDYGGNASPFSQNKKPDGWNHQHLQAHLNGFVQDYGKDFAENMGDPRIKRWQRRNGYTAMKLAYGETIAPKDVDTLRDEECPVCAEKDSYDGNECSVCGFVKPPDMFLDPDLDKAKQLDLRKDQNDQPGGPVGQQPNPLTPAGNQANPGDPNAVDAQGMPNEVPGSGMPGTDQVPIDPNAVDGQGMPTSAPMVPNTLDGQVPGQEQLVPPGKVGPDGQPLIDGNTGLPEIGIPGTPQALPQEPQGPTDIYGQPLGPTGPATPGDPQIPTDPGTNLPVDPVTGQPLDRQPVDPGVQQAPQLQQPNVAPDGQPYDMDQMAQQEDTTLQCPVCGFTTVAAPPMSVTTDMPVGGNGDISDGAQEGDVCPQCGQGLLTSQMQGANGPMMPQGQDPNATTRGAPAGWAPGQSGSGGSGDSGGSDGPPQDDEEDDQDGTGDHSQDNPFGMGDDEPDKDDEDERRNQ
jgi:hypothetical protein